VFELDLDRKIVSWNPAAEKLFGYSVAEACQRQLKNITPPARHHIVDSLWARLLSDPTPLFYLGQGLNRDEEIIELEWYITPITAEDGKILSIITLANDITDRRQLELQVRQSQKMEAIGQLAGGIAHDFNNILAGILGYSELAAESATTAKDASLAGYIAAIHRAGSRGRDLVQQTLNYSRVQPQNLQTINPEPVVTEVLDMLLATLPSTIVIHREFLPSLPTIQTDPTHLHQLIMNICMNAKDAMPGEHGSIRIALSERRVPRSSCHSCQQLFEGDFLQITIEDDGTGIPSDVLSEIFNPFFTTKEVGKGTGLAVADGIIHGNNGHLRVLSTPDTGTRFDVYLPTATDDEVEIEPPVGEKTETPLGIGQHLLVVEDDPALLALTQELVSGQGYQVSGCASGYEALQMLTTTDPVFDLVITDHTMPGMTGVELATELFQLAPQIPVILCTGYMLRTDPNTQLPENIRERLIKPVSNEELFRVVHRLLNEKKATPLQQPPAT